eukprot:366169-Chlamydomonas_euryale.AAC.5
MYGRCPEAGCVDYPSRGAVWSTGTRCKKQALEGRTSTSPETSITVQERRLDAQCPIACHRLPSVCKDFCSWTKAASCRCDLRRALSSQKSVRRSVFHQGPGRSAVWASALLAAQHGPTLRARAETLFDRLAAVDAATPPGERNSRGAAAARLPA